MGPKNAVQSQPLENSYWLLPGQLLGGEYPGGADAVETGERLRHLAAAGIDCFVNLTRPGELPPYHVQLPEGSWYLHLPIQDHGVPVDRGHMLQIQSALELALQSGRRLYVHCRAGIGRTGMVLGCLLVQRGASGEAALAQLNRAWRQSARSRQWPTVPETAEQCEFVRSWRPGSDAPAVSSLGPVGLSLPTPAGPDPTG